MTGTEKPIRSPLFYVGDKYKLMPQLSKVFPKHIENFYDVFCGGGSASINTKASHYYLNDINSKVMEIHRYLQENSLDIEKFILNMHSIISDYGLSHSELGKDPIIEELKKEYKKTYFSKFNKNAYMKLREDYNANQSKTELLYLLLVYGFNHMIRFNKKGSFNLPVGNVDWNSNVSKALNDYSNWVLNNKITLTNLEFEEVLKWEFGENDFLYLDPPYLIAFSEYNKYWNEENELRLYELLDDLDKKGVKWGLSNIVTDHHGNHNHILEKWMQKYKVYKIKSNYISRFDNSIKNTHDIYVTNYYS
ncbi:DNA adenine methylase [Mammaliicoccus sciuri]|uniref:DNA adenine methylase n=1 Tax=Mammaliicoccus sciuri TaxID=1296 RepID=UPI0027E65E84|nr:Dam family site-specific DNA-(adenine-N6)-methyltransferase [Mammaliicoccus sciuri]MDQ7131235.1 Dam family site-specific DNA-(adenine-N6)-methyltransferase [Mammaliicoccus sciuri]